MKLKPEVLKENSFETFAQCGLQPKGGGALSSNAHSERIVDDSNLLPNGGRRWHEVPDEGENQTAQGLLNFTSIAILRTFVLRMTVFRHLEQSERVQNRRNVTENFNLRPFGGRRWHEVPDEGEFHTSQGRHNFINVAILRLKPLNDCKKRGEVNQKSSKIAFTLAEVLITLGIIGVVAALTLPSVITKYQKEQTVVQLKKAYSTLDNASRLSQVDNGEMQTWDKELYHTGIKRYVEIYYLPYFDAEKNLDWIDSKYKISNLGGRVIHDKGARSATIKTKNGQLFIFRQTTNEQSYMWIYADVNGVKGPNRIGRDVFVFDGGTASSIDGKYRVLFWGDGGRVSSRDSLVGDSAPDGDNDNRAYYGCNRKNKYGYYGGFYCGALIMVDGWKISDDYPW